MATESSDVQLPALEVGCERCDGKGGAEERGTWVPCWRCGGAGTTPTTAGKQVLSLLRNHFAAGHATAAQ